MMFPLFNGTSFIFETPQSLGYATGELWEPLTNFVSIPTLCNRGYMQLHEVNLKQSKIDRWIEGCISDNSIYAIPGSVADYFEQTGLFVLFVEPTGYYYKDRHMIVPALP
jgi:hypothetical protein